MLFRFVLFGSVLAVTICYFLISKTKDCQYFYIVFGETNTSNNDKQRFIFITPKKLFLSFCVFQNNSYNEITKETGRTSYFNVEAHNETWSFIGICFDFIKVYVPIRFLFVGTPQDVNASFKFLHFLDIKVYICKTYYSKLVLFERRFIEVYCYCIFRTFLYVSHGL